MPTTVYNQREADKFTTGKHVDLVVVECTCGLLFGIPENLHRSALKHRGPNGWQISCPLGHTWHFTGPNESPEERRLREQLERERSYSANVVARLDQTAASLSATKGVVTKLKKRAANGVCPCCNRSFPKLHEHMKTKHPDYVESEHLPVEAPLDEAAASAIKTQPRSGHLNTDVERIVREKGPVSPAQIVVELGYSTANSVGVALHRLRTDGRVQRKGYGRWVSA